MQQSQGTRKQSTDASNPSRGVPITARRRQTCFRARRCTPPARDSLCSHHYGKRTTQRSIRMSLHSGPLTMEVPRQQSRKIYPPLLAFRKRQEAAETSPQAVSLLSQGTYFIGLTNHSPSSSSCSGPHSDILVHLPTLPRRACFCLAA